MKSLDRPVWASLTHAPHLADGDDLARRYRRDVNLFASACDDSINSLAALRDLVPQGESVFVLQVPAIRERVGGIELRDKSRVFNTARVEALEVENLIEAAQATIVSAAARRECRGAHTVSDYERPADDPVSPLGRDDANWMKHSLWYSEGNRLAYKPVKLKPLSVDSVPPKVRTF